MTEHQEFINLVLEAAAEAAGISVHELSTRRLKKLKIYKFTAIYIMGSQMDRQEIHCLTGFSCDTIGQAFKLTKKKLDCQYEPQAKVLEEITARMNLIKTRMVA